MAGTLVTKLQFRYGTAQQWTDANTIAPIVLIVAERGYETDTKKWKTGDGATAWDLLEYDTAGGSALEILDEGVSITTAATSIDFVGDNVTATNTDGAVTVTVTGSTSDGDVVGPATSVPGNLASFSDGTGKIIADSGISPSSFLTSETDPVFSGWDKSTGISITESQISDFGTYEPANSNIQTHISTQGNAHSATLGDLGVTPIAIGTWCDAHSKTTLASGDYFAIADSEDSFALKGIIRDYIVGAIGAAPLSHAHQAGIEDVPAITSGSGLVNVAQGDVWYYTDSTHIELEQITISQTTGLTPTDDVNTYIVADKATQAWIALPSLDTVDNIGRLLYAIIFKRSGSIYMHTQVAGLQAHGEIEANHNRTYACGRYDREEGALLSLTVADTTRAIALGGGGVWAVSTRYPLPAVTATTDQFSCVITTGTWSYTRTTGCTLPNTQYNGAAGLVTMTDTYWAILHVWRGVEAEDHLYTYLSDAEYATKELAQASKSLGIVPALASSHAVYVGRIVFQKNATTSAGWVCEGAFDTVFQASSSITDHGALTGLTDDDHSQYHNDTRGDLRYVAKNAAITGLTATKITYDAKGLVTGGSNATTADIADSTDKRYCTDAQKTIIGNTSNTNTGDVSLATNHGLGLSGQQLSMGTPSSITTTSTNSVSTTTHTHAITGFVPSGGALGTPTSGNLANCTFPTLNQPTSSTAANLSGTPALPNGVTAATQTQADNSTKLATTAYVDTGLGGKANTSHNHSATEINSGTLNGDRLPSISTTKAGAVPATGTASGKYLKDDGTWASIPGGGDLLSTNNLSDLTSAPTALSNLVGAFTGNSLKAVRVNTGETDLEYYTPSASGGGGDGGFSFKYTFDTGTTNTPASGEIRCNSATLANITAVYINEHDASGVDIDSVLDELSIGGQIMLSNADKSAFHVFMVISEYASGAGVDSIPVTWQFGTASIFSDGETIYLSYKTADRRYRMAEAQFIMGGQFPP